MIESEANSYRVAVLPFRDRVKGTNSLEDLGTPIETYSLVDAFHREWDTDAHFLLYLTDPFDPQEPFYRLNKAVLPEIRTMGGRVLVHLISIDYDNPDHAHWTKELWDAFQVTLYRTRGTPFEARLKSAAFAYSTRGGYRWVFRLASPVDAEEVEPLIRGMIQEFRANGIDADNHGVLSTWNLDFRLPRVLRVSKDGTTTSRTVLDPFFMEDHRPEQSIDPGSIIPLGSKVSSPFAGISNTITSSSDEEERPPADDEAEILLVSFNDQNKPVYTEFYKQMRKQLKGQAYYPYIFDLQKFDIEEGSRHDVLREWTASAMGHALSTIPYITSKHIYALFLPATKEYAEQAPSEEEKKRRKRDVWRLCSGTFWRKVKQEWEEQKQQEVQKKEEVEKARVETGNAIERGVRGWYPQLVEDPVEAWAWIQRRFIILVDKQCFIMRPDGFYSSEGDRGIDEVLARIIQLKMDVHIPVVIEGRDGPRPVKMAELATEFVTRAFKIEPKCEVEGGFLLNPEKTEGLVMGSLSFRRRRDLVPTFNADVDRWLRALGGQMYELLCKHIGCFLAFERGGVAAMSFSLPPSSGKKLLTHGLMECMENAIAASGDDLVQKFNGKLAKAAFLFANEGLPQVHGGNHASDTLRRIITGDLMQTEGKNRDAVDLKFPIRVVLTANHWRLIDALGEGRDLSIYEQEALGLRLIHYTPDPEDAPAKLLAEMGGDAWTKGWIAGDSNHSSSPSQFTVAKHFLWLYEQHGKNAVSQGRLLIQGDPKQPAIQRLRVQGGSTPLVMEAICKMLNSQDLNFKTDGSTHRVLIDGSRLFVTVGAILDFAREHLSKGSGERLSTKRIRMSLQGLVVGKMGVVQRIHGNNARWNEIDISLLKAEADKNGWPCKKLDDLYRARLTNIMGEATTNGVTRTNGTSSIHHVLLAHVTT